MSIVQMYRFFALACVAMAPTAAGAGVKADHCGSIVSSNGEYRASFTLVRAANPDARTIRVFLCDRSYNCDTVFEAPHDAKVSMQWRSNAELAVLSGSGSLVTPGTIDSVAKGRPPVRILTQVDELEGASGMRLDFAASSCRVEAPIASQQAASPF